MTTPLCRGVVISLNVTVFSQCLLPNTDNCAAVISSRAKVSRWTHAIGKCEVEVVSLVSFKVTFTKLVTGLGIPFDTSTDKPDLSASSGCIGQALRKVTRAFTDCTKTIAIGRSMRQ